MPEPQSIPDGLIDELAAFPAQLRRCTASLPPAALDFAPADWTGSPAENMSVRQQICHLRDIEIDGYHARIARTLAEERPFLPSIDGHALCLERGYSEAPLAAALDEFDAARARTIRLLKNLNPSDFSRAAEFEGVGGVTLLGLIHMLASHDSQHLSGIHWLNGKRAVPD